MNVQTNFQKHKKKTHIYLLKHLFDSSCFLRTLLRCITHTQPACTQTHLLADIRELALDPSDQYTAAPLENDMFEWHFTIRGAVDTDFDGGIYHGRILLPPEYPFKPPHIVFLTQSGRFDINTKVCLSFSAYHPELWQPAWGIRLILEALISFLPTPGDGAIGALDYSSKERKRLAKESISYCCKQCGPIINLLPKLDPDNDERKKSDMATKKKSSSSFAKEIEELKRLQLEREGKRGGATNNNMNETNHNSNNIFLITAVSGG